jgi:tetratricopeptide (TPR) repeat protein
MIAHTISMGPIMLNYAAIEVHRDEIFEKWTLDGDYAFSNFGHFDIYSQLEYITDSDSFMVLGFTPKNEEVPKPAPVGGPRFFLDLVKGTHLWRVYSDAVADPLKKRLYVRQVVFHDGDLDEKWRALARRDRRILESNVVCRIDDKKILAYYWRYRGASKLGASTFPLALKFRAIRLGIARASLKISQLFREFVLGHLDSWEAYQRRGIRRDAAGNYLRAARDLAEAIRLGPPNPALHYLRGVALLHATDKPEAAKEFEAGLKLDPDNVTLRGLLASCYEEGWEVYQSRGLKRGAEGDHRGAAEKFAHAIRVGPPNPALHYLRGIALLRAADKPGAAEAFEAGLRLDPDNGTLRSLLEQARDPDSSLPDAARVGDLRLQLSSSVSLRAILACYIPGDHLSGGARLALVKLLVKAGWREREWVKARLRSYARNAASRTQARRVIRQIASLVVFGRGTKAS